MFLNFFIKIIKNTEEDNSCVYAVLNLEKPITTEIDFLGNIEYLGNGIQHINRTKKLY